MGIIGVFYSVSIFRGLNSLYCVKRTKRNKCGHKSFINNDCD